MDRSGCSALHGANYQLKKKIYNMIHKDDIIQLILIKIKGLGIVSLLHFVHDFSRKMFFKLCIFY